MKQRWLRRAVTSLRVSCRRIPRPACRRAVPGLLLCAWLPSTLVGAAESGRQGDHKRLLGNTEAIRRSASADNLAPLPQLDRELANLWDAGAIGRRPLEPQVVYSESNKAGYPGYKIEGVYVNGAQGGAGTDRVFFYYSRPKNVAGRLPVFLELTGGAKDETANVWMASALRCAVVHVEYRCTDARFRSKWAGYPRPGRPAPTMQDMSSLRNNFLYRVVSGTRRIVDYLSAQPEIDAAKIGCGGGSMGGYLTLLLAGVDARIAFGVDELGAGWKSEPQGGFGTLWMPDDYKVLWSKAFNACLRAPGTKARIYVNLSSNDAAFPLGDGLDNYLALPGEKRLGICPNDNHASAGFAQEHWLPLFTWVPYCIGMESDYPQITSVRAKGDRYSMTVKDRAAVRRASLYWSPGENVAWPARYWKQIPATPADGSWQAQIPARYSGLAKRVFMTVVDDKGRRVSSLPALAPGADPRERAGPLWDGDQLWDAAQGVSAWRPVGGIAVRRGAMNSRVAFSPPHALTVGPEMNDTRFTLLTNSIILAAGHATTHRGLELAIDGHGKPGEILVSLVRNAGSARTEVEFSHALRYGPAEARYRIAWSAFTSPTNPGQSPLKFDGLRIDGARDDGSTLALAEVALF
jgi:dienelactone hydrolase